MPRVMMWASVLRVILGNEMRKSLPMMLLTTLLAAMALPLLAAEQAVPAVEVPAAEVGEAQVTEGEPTAAPAANEDSAAETPPNTKNTNATITPTELCTTTVKTSSRRARASILSRSASVSLMA